MKPFNSRITTIMQSSVQDLYMLSTAGIRIKDGKLEQTFANKPQKHTRTGNKASKLHHLGGDWEIILGTGISRTESRRSFLFSVGDLQQKVFLSLETSLV